MVSKWYSLFSHTGKETEALTHSLWDDGVRLERAYTDNQNFKGDLNLCGAHVCIVKSRAALNEMLCSNVYFNDESLITLNGYMGIVPADTLRNLHVRGCKVYNIHPAPIQLYPELRGKDPQERMYEGIQQRKYAWIGVVIHEVDEGVDTGKIVHWVLQMADHGMTKDELYVRLHELGTQAWESFFRERMYESGENH